jgi:hypothetical protein
MLSRSQSRVQFANRPAQVALSAFGFGIALLGVAMLVTADLFGIALALVGVLLAARALTTSCLTIDDTGVTTRSLIRKRRFEFEDLRGVDVEVGRTGMNGFDREYLVLHCSDGIDYAFKDLNNRPGPSVDRSVVQLAADGIRRRLQS